MSRFIALSCVFRISFFVSDVVEYVEHFKIVTFTPSVS
jgi:hypothetical protein